jgi:hypothetical protein
MTQREKIWNVIGRKKTKSDFYEISSLVSEIEQMIADARLEGILDAIDHLQIDSSHASAEHALRQKFVPQSLEG